MKKIMFNSKFGLEQAVLEGRKMQTRRIITTPQMFKGNYVAGFHVYKRKLDGFISEICMYDEDERDFDEGQIVPKYNVGEIVAIAQSYKDCGYDENALDISPKDYRISRGILGNSKGWSNKMFVRADACKHQIRIINVRMERLQDISNEDCLKEGVVKCDAEDCNNRCYLMSKCDFCHCGNAKYTPREAYAALIDKVSGKGTWQNNPYVFVYDFELVK